MLKIARKLTATVSICVKGRNYRGQWKQHGRQALRYGYWGLRPWPAQWIHETCRFRFGIESSSGHMYQARIRTWTRSPLLRLLYVGVTLILRSVWVWLHRQVLARGRRGGRIDLNQLEFRKMLVWSKHVIEAIGMSTVSSPRNVHYLLDLCLPCGKPYAPTVQAWCFISPPEALHGPWLCTYGPPSGKNSSS
jgi:hypothetical protein